MSDNIEEIKIRNQKSLVSVIIPTFNRPKIIIEAINSVLNQTYQKFEIIIIDDGSTEPYPDLTQLDPKQRITYHKEKINQGPAITRNIGLDLVNGTYVCFLDDDDLFLPTHLLTGVFFLDENPEIHGIYFDSIGIREKQYMKDMKGRIYGLPWYVTEKNNPCRSCSMIFRKNEYRLENERFEDYSLWKKFYKNNLKCIHIPIVTSIYRKYLSERSE